MKIEKLMAKDIIDLETEIHYHFLTHTENSCTIHNHDFYEIFIIIKGSVIHNINGMRQRLTEGSMVFIRPQDIHYYEKDENEENHIINLAFTFTLAQELFLYLGDGFHSERILKCDFPSIVMLSTYEKALVMNKIKELFVIPNIDKKITRTQARILLFELITSYFHYGEYHNIKEMPLWLKNTLKEMSKAENIKEGLGALIRLSDKTPEHISRVLKKHIGKNPTDYVNELKIHYAANLLLHSDEEIINIALMVGIDNLSYFYQLFKRHFKVSPGRYRNENKKFIV